MCWSKEFTSNLAQDLHLIGLDLAYYVLSRTKTSALDCIKRRACRIAPYPVLLTTQLRHLSIRMRNSWSTDERPCLVSPPVRMRWIRLWNWRDLKHARARRPWSDGCFILLSGFKVYFSHDIIHILVLLPCHRYVFIIDINANLTLVIFFYSEVFMVEPVNKADWKHISY